MEQGRIQSQGGVTLFWLPEGQKVRFASQSPKAVRFGKCGVWTSAAAESYYCRDCKKIITDVKNSVK